MKKLFFAFLIVFSAFSVYAQNTGLSLQSGDLPQFKWATPIEHEFGKIPQGIPATTTFEFENTGKSELILSNVKASCGCTTPDYSKEPIQPGKKGFIKATYNAAGMGVFHKSITVTSNVSEQPVVLTIKGEVIANSDSKPAETPAEPAKTTPVVEKPAPVSTSSTTTAGALKVSKTVNILFANGSTAISAADSKALEGIVAEMKSNKNAQLILNGYASKTGKSAVNKKISEQRAEAVKSKLTKGGVEAGRISVQSYGDSGATGNSENDRRVEVLLLQ